jgi:hypothetical protein
MKNSMDNKKFTKVVVISLIVILALLAVISVGKREHMYSSRFATLSQDSDEAGVAMMESTMGYAADSFAAPIVGSGKMIAPYPTPPTTAGQTAAEADARVIKTADLELGVDGVAEKTNQVAELANAKGGFVESSTVVEDKAGYKTGYITVRVPVEKFDEAVSAIKDLAVRVERESVNGRDVTEQYTDLEARLRSAQAQEEQYLTILEKADTVQDILAVQQYLQNVRYEIESLQGQINSLGNQTDYSTISVTLNEEVRLQVPAEKFDLGRDIKTALQSVVLLVQAGLTFVVYFVIVGGAMIIPLGLIVLIAVLIIRRVVRRL